MSYSLISTVRTANTEFAGFFQEMMPSSSDRQGAVPSPSRIESLTRILVQVGSLLANVPPEERKGQDLDSEILLYISNLAQLRQILTDVHTELHSQRRRLEADRTSLQAVRNWAEALKDTV